MTTHAVWINRNKTHAATTVTETVERRVEFDYLRAFVVVLVVWHHAILAYHTFAYLNPANPIDTFSPVVDAQRWAGFDILAGLNDTFFMALMFFISGLFVWQSLARKGAGKYVMGRLMRLGIPFLVAVPLLIPLALYPAQLLVDLVYGGSTSYPEFWRGMVQTGFSTAGPLWFLWLLIVFDCLAALVFAIMPDAGAFLQRKSRAIFERPLAFYGALLVISTIAYLPMVIAFGPTEWIGLGPFVAQGARIFFYLVYFCAGIAVGAYGLDRGIAQSGGPLARRWWAWLIVGLLLFVVLLVLIVDGAPNPIIGALVFALCCAALVFGSLAFFLRFATRRTPVLDSLAANAYGIYIVHYVFVTWLQYWLLGSELPVGAKAIVAFTGTLLLSWGVIAAVRRIPIVAKVI